MAYAAKQSPSKPCPKGHAYCSESTGLLIISILILLTMLVRDWHHPAWSAR